MGKMIGVAETSLIIFGCATNVMGIGDGRRPITSSKIILSSNSWRSCDNTPSEHGDFRVLNVGVQKSNFGIGAVLAVRAIGKNIMVKFGTSMGGGFMLGPK